MSSKRRPTMSSIVSDSKSIPPAQKRKRLPPGIHGEIFVGVDGTHYELKQKSLPVESYKSVMTKGAQIIFDECGCGGDCGFVYAGIKEQEELRRKIPSLDNKKGQTGLLSLWQAEDGSQVILVQGPVSWI